MTLKRMEVVMNKKYEIDMLNGPLLGKILMFSLPLMASGILQLLFNAADMIVAGRFAGSVALAAIGATSSLINLLVNVFLGLSVGANVTIAHYYGAKRDRDTSETVHTSVQLAIIGGIFLAFFGMAVSAPMLRIMGTPAEVLPHSAIYMKIYFAGMPAMLLYNFGAAILRAVGDTKRPLAYLTIAGVINVVLNMFFVIVLSMGVRGVALATVLSQIISAALVIRALMQSEGSIKFEFNKMKLYRDKAWGIARIGLPAGFQGAMFSISNVLIQSSINTFGAVAVAGNTASMSLEGFVYSAMNSYNQTAMSFTGQNMGAGKFDRVKRIMWLCLACVTVTGLLLGGLSILFGHRLLGFYSNEAEVIAVGFRRVTIIMSLYFICGLMDSMVGVIRGMGYSIMPMIVSLLGACVFRVIWVYTAFRIVPTLECLYVSYPLSWTLTLVAHLVCFAFAWRHLQEKIKREV